MKLLTQAILSGISMLVQMYCLKHMPQGDVGVISGSSLAFTAFLAFFILHERITFRDILNVLIVIMGIVLIVKPPFIFGYGSNFDQLKGFL